MSRKRSPNYATSAEKISNKRIRKSEKSKKEGTLPGERREEEKVTIQPLGSGLSQWCGKACWTCKTEE